jgi:hypothetical protein
LWRILAIVLRIFGHQLLDGIREAGALGDDDGEAA